MEGAISRCKWQHDFGARQVWGNSINFTVGWTAGHETEWPMAVTKVPEIAGRKHAIWNFGFRLQKSVWRQDLETIGFMAVWEFQVREESQAQFEKVYGMDGEWAQLFRRSPGYVRTELLKDAHNPGRYVTLDLWDSQKAYESFKAEHAPEYKTIDQFCENLTVSEIEIGEFALAANHG
jgi:heme-degrading monooxygenase HmoA